MTPQTEKWWDRPKFKATMARIEADGPFQEAANKIARVGQDVLVTLEPYSRLGGEEQGPRVRPAKVISRYPNGHIELIVFTPEYESGVYTLMRPYFSRSVPGDALATGSWHWDPKDPPPAGWDVSRSPAE